MQGRAFFDEDHLALLEGIEKFAEGVLAPRAAEIDETEVFPKELMQQIADIGLFGMKIPEEYGGLGLDTRSYALALEAVNRKNSAAGIIVSQANSLSTQAVVKFGTPEQKEAWLPGVADGSRVIAFGLTEPGAGSDNASMKAKAEKVDGGYIINAQKTFITAAPMADNCLLFAKTAPELGAKGISCFMIDMDMKGVSTGKPEKKMGCRGIPVSDLICEDVFVPEDRLIGEENKGFTAAMKTLSVARIGAAASALGIAQSAMDEAVKYTRERVQFGKPLYKHQGLSFMMADMEAKLRACRLLVYQAAYKADMGEEVNMDASVAKYLTTETACEIADKALQLHGGYGYVQEYPIERIYRDARFHRLGEGTSQIQQLIIGRELFK